MSTSKANISSQGRFRVYEAGNKKKWINLLSFADRSTTLDWAKMLEENSLIIEVGAEDGKATIPLSMFHAHKVIAIEPNIYSHVALLNNLALNNIGSDKVEPLNIAISTQYSNKYQKVYLSSNSFCATEEDQNESIEENSERNEQTRYQFAYHASLASIVKQSAQSHGGPIHLKINNKRSATDICQSLFETKQIHRISSLLIKLDLSVPSHRSLIETLSLVGYFYSEKQHQEFNGDNRGEVEIIFRKSITQACIGRLPSSYINLIGKNYISFPNSYRRVPESTFFGIEEAKILPLSTEPATYAFKNALEVANCADLFHKISSKILSSDLNEFSFDGDKSSKQKSLRITIELKAIKAYSRSYLSELRKIMNSKISFPR